MKRLAFIVIICAVSPAYAESALEFAAAGMGRAVVEIAQPVRHGRYARQAVPLDIRSAPQIVAEAARCIGTRIGSIAVLRHHVGIVVGRTARGPVLLSGNHSRRVGVGVYSARRILAYREPV